MTTKHVDPDAQWFSEHPDRSAHIRKPVKELYKDRQRAMHYMDECDLQFRELGPHNKDRRCILLWKVPYDNPYYDAQKPQILKVPMLAFADETIEDDDATLLPIIHDLMVDNARRYGKQI